MSLGRCCLGMISLLLSSILLPGALASEVVGKLPVPCGVTKSLREALPVAIGSSICRQRAVEGAVTASFANDCGRIYDSNGFCAGNYRWTHGPQFLILFVRTSKVEGAIAVTTVTVGCKDEATHCEKCVERWRQSSETLSSS